MNTEFEYYRKKMKLIMKSYFYKICLKYHENILLHIQNLNVT